MPKARRSVLRLNLGSTFALPREHAVDFLTDAIARFPALGTMRQQLVIVGLVGTYTRDDSQLHRLLVEAFGGQRPTRPLYFWQACEAIRSGRSGGQPG